MSPNAASRPLILASTSRYRAGLLQRFGLEWTRGESLEAEAEELRPRRAPTSSFSSLA